MRVDVSPDMGMYKLLTRQGYDPSFAIAEFIDNAIDAHQKYRVKNPKKAEQLEITLKFYSASYHDAALRNSICIEDNGPGITQQRLRDALKPAKVATTEGLSEFGIGMKAAAVWFADVWTLDTVPVAGPHKYDAKFDLTDLLATGESTIEVNESPRSGAKAGTTLTLLSLRRAITKELYDVIRPDLVELYQRFTEGNNASVSLMAEFDGTISDLNYVLPPGRATLVAERYDTRNSKTYLIGPKREWSVVVSFVYEGKKVDGFISLLEVGSYKSNPGLVLFRNDRVISGTSRTPNIPVDLVGTSNKYGRQRVYGELNMDGLPITYTKDRFEIDEAAFIKCLGSVAGVDELIKQSEKYRTNLKDGTWEKISENGFLKKTAKAGSKTKETKPKPSGGANPTAAGGKAGAGPGAQPAPATPPPDLSTLLTELQNKTTSLALKAVLDEAIYQYRRRRPIATALCLRIVLEAGALEKIRVSHPTVYPTVSSKAIKSLVTYMHGNMTTFFDKNVDYKVIKCIQNNSIDGQGDVMLLNNISHGHYAPQMHEVEKFMTNLEPFLLWAYS